MKVKIKSARNWKDHKNCHLGISLHNPNLAGPALEAIVSWINEQHFEEVFVDLSDTLHRHNLALAMGLDEAAAHRQALEEGDKWLQANQSILQKLRMPFRLYRWDYWLKFKGVIRNYEAYKRAFIRDEYFRDAIYRDIQGFTARNGAPLDRTQLQTGVRYMLEELTVLSFYFEEYPCAKLYPGREQHSFRLVREGGVKNVPQALQGIFYTQMWLCKDVENTTSSSLRDVA